MAGIIVFRSGDWYSSGGAFRAMAAGVMPHLPGTEAGAQIKGRLSEAVESHLYFMDCEDVSPGALSQFLEALDKHIAEETNAPASSEVPPEIHRGYMDRIRELRSILASLVVDWGAP